MLTLDQVLVYVRAVQAALASGNAPPPSPSPHLIRVNQLGPGEWELFADPDALNVIVDFNVDADLSVCTQWSVFWEDLEMHIENSGGAGSPVFVDGHFCSGRYAFHEPKDPDAFARRFAKVFAVIRAGTPMPPVTARIKHNHFGATYTYTEARFLGLAG
jgi:hypothetical protein